jgi:hypothetical protein
MWTPAARAELANLLRVVPPRYLQILDIATDLTSSEAHF